MKGYVAEEQLKVSVFNDTLDMAIAQVAQVTRRFTGMNGHGKQIWVAAPALRSNSDRDAYQSSQCACSDTSHAVQMVKCLFLVCLVNLSFLSWD